MLYFGGFGVQVGRQSYLLPIDAAIWREADVRRDGTSVDWAQATKVGYSLLLSPLVGFDVLSSGVAGTMAANKSGLQMATLRNLALAWVLTMPAAIVLSGSLYWLFTHVF